MPPITNWPEDERPREKMHKFGPDALSDAELLALIIRSGDHASRQSAIDLGRNILKEFGDLRNIAGATMAEICAIKGAGPAKAASVLAALTLAQRINTARLANLERFTTPSQVFQHFHYRFRDRRKEYFLILLLDGKNRILREVQISEGSLNQSIVHPREVFNPAVRESAAAVILVHNHPSGDPTPSREDLEISKRLKEAGELLGIRVLDHIIVGDNAYVSFVERGLF
ncbi:RadC family protein [Geobacter argillaceus]|uniref:DNA replication and repair protein RadC n=1 Tax=Geobacter argillaceus TaxID=345631 RepID=A0A562VJT2_9BACT|nr:DNA repair protein RadC [Geobacter argillaceus]TWJ18007.1 DNA replication and repair protein RadC [Geobacter argillaceus]